MSGIKVITVTSYDEKGEFTVRGIYTLTKSFQVRGFPEARAYVERTLAKTLAKEKRCTVEWKRDGDLEGFMLVRP